MTHEKDRDDMIRCSCGRVLAERQGNELFLRWRCRRVHIVAAAQVEIICERCRAKTVIGDANDCK